MGRFRFDSVPSGVVRLSVRRLGYNVGVRDSLKLEAGELLVADVRMVPSIVMPDPPLQFPLADSGASGAYAGLDTTHVIAYTAFSFALFKAVTHTSSTSNVFVSPASAAFALAMTASGATGATWSAMSRTLGTSTLTPQQLGNYNAAELISLRHQAGVELTVANSIWADSGRPFLAAFLDGAHLQYQAHVSSIGLHDVTAEAVINRWVSHATNGRISSVLDKPLAPEIAMLLVNAVYFKGQWVIPFDSGETKPHRFTLSDGTHVQRPLMTRRDHAMQYLSDSGVSMVRLPYQGGRIAMYVVLPDSDRSIAAAVSRLTPVRWARWMRTLTNRDVHLRLPRFRLEYGGSLNTPLESLGMAIAFDCGRATFDRMLPREYTKNKPTCIDKVVQRTFVDVNEQGTEAAAATGVSVVVTGGLANPPPPIEFIVDRPFVVAIRDDRTGLLLFLGRITDPPPN